MSATKSKSGQAMQRVATHLYRRHGRYTFRRAIPKDVQAACGITEYVRSLGDVTDTRARALANVHAEYCDRMIRQARASTGRDKASHDDIFRTAHIPDQEEIERAVRAWIVEFEDRSSADPLVGGVAVRSRSREQDVAESEIVRVMANGTGEPPISTQWIADAIIQRNAWAMPRDGRLEAFLMDRVARGQRELVSRERADITWSSTIGPTHRIFAPEEFAKGRARSQPSKNPQARLSLSQIVDRWAAARKPRSKTERKARVVIAEFDALTGGARIGAITSDHVQAYKEKLIASGRAGTTGNNLLNLLRAVIRFAKECKVINVDPCEGIAIKADKKKAKARITYDRDCLTALFGTSVWSSGNRPVGGRGEAAYWLPLLALYTGARLEELGQLRLIDIASEAYVDADDADATATVIRIVEDEADGLKLKNAGSVRRVPVHAELVRLGFLNYVDQLRATGAKRVFPDLRPDRDGVLTASWSKWFGRWLRKEAKITDRRITFHSFRHSFKHYSRQLGLAPDVQNEITGHETGDIADTYGGLSYPLLPLVHAIERYRVPGFVLPPPPQDMRKGSNS
ncbi:DUF6538 domain-containing protein [Sphingopyxis terrae]|uniref:DUF6538 domain-containing protein n=1 Tax=Sphingopyxis terrae TaxID=33052 RepID=UPI003464382D